VILLLTNIDLVGSQPLRTHYLAKFLAQKIGNRLLVAHGGDAGNENSLVKWGLQSSPGYFPITVANGPYATGMYLAAVVPAPEQKSGFVYRPRTLGGRCCCQRVSGPGLWKIGWTLLENLWQRVEELL